MRFFLLAVVLFVFVVGPVGAQRLPASTLPDSLLAAPPAPDTVAAIHRLFVSRRARSYLITTLVIVPGVVAYLVDGNSIGTAAYPVAAGPYELANLICHRRYRKKAEERALLNFRAHQLSPRIKRRLKPKYFTDAPALRHF